MDLASLLRGKRKIKNTKLQFPWSVATGSILVLAFLRDTWIGSIVPQALRIGREEEDGREVGREGEEGGPGLP